jgi:hypothetical protein
MKIFMRAVIASIGALAVMFTAVPATAKKKPEMTPLELQALQSREFETGKENLFNAVMTVVQDLGYQVQSADMQTGFITAVSAAEQKTNFLEALGGGRSTAVTKMTAFVQNMPNGMSRVRLNFMFSKTSSTLYGQANQQDKPILDPLTYRAAWEKVDEALFVLGALEPSKKPENAPAAAAPSATTAPSASSVGALTN